MAQKRAPGSSNSCSSQQQPQQQSWGGWAANVAGKVKSVAMPYVQKATTSFSAPPEEVVQKPSPAPAPMQNSYPTSAFDEAAIHASVQVSC